MSEGNNLRYRTRGREKVNERAKERSRSGERMYLPPRAEGGIRCKVHRDMRSPNGLGAEHDERAGRLRSSCAQCTRTGKPTGDYEYNMRTTRVTELEREHAMEADVNDRTAAALSRRVEPPTIEPR